MINLFFDTEFTHIQEPLDPTPPGLVSVGVISGDGERRFYAENADMQAEMFSDFTKETVVPLLEGGDARIPYVEIAHRLKSWIEEFDGEVKMWSDAPYWDWMHIKHLFDTHGWPANLVQKPIALAFASSIQTTRFKAAVEDIFRSNHSLRRHHALDDAIVNRQAFARATARRY